ncbi:MAG: hypothetical protein AAF153_03140, partial [Pseudomonadota bacterium]
YRLASVNWLGGEKSKTLELVIDQPDYSPIKISDCERVSKTASAILDVEDVIHQQYELRVSSPGIDRDLFTINDYLHFCNHEVKIWLHQPMLLPNGNLQSRVRGVIKQANIETISIKLTDIDDVLNIDFSTIDRCKLELTDKLIKTTNPKNNSTKEQV